jgi:hypothetical protein
MLLWEIKFLNSICSNLSIIKSQSLLNCSSYSGTKIVQGVSRRVATLKSFEKLKGLKYSVELMYAYQL